jgi:hypothetical protein
MTPEQQPVQREEIPLREIFNKAVREAKASYPELKGRFAVVNLPDKRIHGLIELEKTSVKSEIELEKTIRLAMESSQKHRSSMASVREGVMLICYNPTPASDNMFTTANMPKPMNVLAIFDHELGHLLIKDALKNATLSESLYSEAAADVYAAIRNMQRFGKHAQGASVVSWRRAVSFVERGGQTHFTFFALDALAQLKDKFDVTELDPQQTLDLARRIALEHVPHENLVRALSETFAPYREALKTQTREEALKTLMEITLDEKSGPHALRLGARFLEKYLKGVVRFGEKRTILEGPWWDAKRKELEHRLAQAEEQGILYGLPQKQPANTNLAPPVKRRWWQL